MKTVNLSYSAFKGMAESKSMRVQYQELDDRIELFAFDGPLVCYQSAIIKKGAHEGVDMQAETANLADFTENVKSSANARIWSTY